MILKRFEEKWNSLRRPDELRPVLLPPDQHGNRLRGHLP